MLPVSEVLPAGTVIGQDFRIVQHIAAGGMGAVYLAEQISTGQRRALKVMHPALVQDPGMRDRFVQEARVGSMISSDHVVSVVGAGVDAASGAPWIAMEFLEGQDLAAFVAGRGPLAPNELAMVLRPICHALGAAHAAGVVHRDVKPENVFLAATRSMDPFTSVKVLDFGIAKVAAQARATATASMGTPLWMAPEQTDPRARITPAVDVWAIGLIAFWMLTGKSYWRAANAQGTSVHALMREILFEPLDPASARAAEYGLAGRFPQELDTWFATATAREPEQRYPNAEVAFAELVKSSPAIAAVTSIPPPTMLSSGPSHPVQASVPSPVTGPTLAATTATSPPRASGSSLGIFVGAAGVLIALVAVVIAGVAVYFSTQKEDPREPVVSARTADVVPSNTAPVVVTSAPVPTASVSIVDASVPKKQAPAVPAKPADPPFDLGAAINSVNAQGNLAKFHCKTMDGPATFSGMAHFNNPGNVQRTDFNDIAGSATTRGGCVRGMIGGARVKAFSGAAKPVPFAVAF